MNFTCDNAYYDYLNVFLDFWNNEDDDIFNINI